MTIEAFRPDIRLLDVAGVETVLDWAAAEGWNPGLADGPAFHAADPGGFLGLFDAGELVSAISAVRSGEPFGFVGLFITRPDRRGRGFGAAVWKAGLDRLAGRTIGLDGVVEQQANYRTRGFVPSFRALRYAGTAMGGTAHPSVIDMAPRHDDDVLAIDRRCFPAPRASFLRRWLPVPHRTLIHREGNGIDGFLTLRRCREGHKIGPLFATGPRAAERLFDAALRLIPGERVVIDIPEPNRAAIRMAEAAGLVPCFETARMYRGPAPVLPLAHIHGMTSLELG